MNLNFANELWKLIRDVLLVLSGIFLLIMLATGHVPPNIAPLLVPVCGGLLALPSWIRSGERKQQDSERKAASSNGIGGDGRDDR